MTSRLSRSAYTCVFAIAMIAGRTFSADAATIKVAFWNVMSGKGVAALAGHAAPFVNVTNCTDPTQPLNAWGVGATQAELAKIAADPSLVALGVNESWGSVCGSPENIRKALGWKARTSENNGVGLVARYGFAGPEQWLQLDTTLNASPGDTMWLLRIPVCLDSACSQSMPVYVTHWYGTGSNAATSYARQAQQTVAFLNATAQGLPHVLIGDLNVWEGSTKVCNQNPSNGALPYLRDAGYLDAWLTVRGSTEGATGMANRAGCGYPEGYAWKRIDYAWTLPGFQPTNIQRFAVTTPGDASPSDHYGIVVTLPNPGGSQPVPVPDPAPAPAPALASVWTSLVKTVATGATLQKTSGCGECFDAGATGTQPIGDGGSVSFTVSAGHRLIVGLGSDTTAATSYVMDYAFSFWPNGTWEIREKGSYRKEGAFTATDQFKVAVEGAAVKYYRNGTLVYTSAVAATSPLVLDSSLNSIGATVVNLTPVAAAPAPEPLPAAGPENVVWTSLVKTAAAGALLQKISGCGECFDAGAVSQQQIASDGALLFTVSSGARLVVGLGQNASADAGFGVDYAFGFYTNGSWEIREKGIYKSEGVSGTGDVFTVAVKAGGVKYYKNGSLVYSSAAAVTGTLSVDTSLHTIGAAVTSAVIVR